MRLENFRVQNCFGFRDSGKVNLVDANNFIYILGRNSSGKTSLLNSLRCLNSGVVLADQPNFSNFKDYGSWKGLQAEFSITENDFKIETFIKGLHDFFGQNSITVAEINATPQIKSLVETISSTYKDLIERIENDKKVVVHKAASSDYIFTSISDYNDYKSRQSDIEKAIKTASAQSVGQFLVSSAYRQTNISFNAIENLLFKQFPHSVLFSDRYSLEESLPFRITPELLADNAQRNKFLNVFISILRTVFRLKKPSKSTII